MILIVKCLQYGNMFVWDRGLRVFFEKYIGHWHSSFWTVAPISQVLPDLPSPKFKQTLLNRPNRELEDVGRLFSTENVWFSGSILIEGRVKCLYLPVRSCELLSWSQCWVQQAVVLFFLRLCSNLWTAWLNNTFNIYLGSCWVFFP